MDLESSFFTNREFVEYVWPDFSNMQTKQMLFFRKQCSDNVAGMMFYELYNNNCINDHW